MYPVLQIFFQTAQLNNQEDALSLEDIENSKKGRCAWQREWFASKLLENNITFRYVTIPIPSNSTTGHSAIEVFYNDSWHYFDISNGIFFLSANNNEIASWCEVVDYSKKKGCLPQRVQLLDKLIFSTPSRNQLYPITSCLACGTNGIIDVFYSWEHIVNMTVYYRNTIVDAYNTDNWCVYSVLNDDYVDTYDLYKKRSVK